MAERKIQTDQIDPSWLVKYSIENKPEKMSGFGPSKGKVGSEWEFDLKGTGNEI
jgi:hypothetical protein